MEDRLKKFVNENRQAFERHQPSPLVWDRIKKNLPPQTANTTPEEEKVTPIRWMRSARTWYAAASIVAILTVTGIFWRQLTQNGIATDENIQTRLAQQEQLSDSSNDVVNTTTEQPTSSPLQSTISKDGSTHNMDARTATIKPAKTQKHVNNNRPLEMEMEDPLVKSYALLADEHSAINRMEGVLQLASLDYIPDAAMAKIQQLMGSDPNENIRLAAYDIFMEHVSAEQKEKQIQDVFLQQKDPAMQMELMHAMVDADALQINDATTKRLEAIVEDPLTIDLVKDQAYAVLMKNW